MNYAILLSGGVGSRISSDIPKQYVRVNGHMMVSFALKTLVECKYIDSVYIVAAEDWIDEIMSDAADMGIDVSRVGGTALPGGNRQGSILNGMRAIAVAGSGDKDSVSSGVGDPVLDDGRQLFSDDDTVLVHDAARPMLSEDMLQRCYEALPGHEGVMPVLPMKDTVYMSRDGKMVSALLDRSMVFAGQAPELFNLSSYYRANTRLLPDDINAINGATEPAIMAGMDVVMVPGDEANFKVTTDGDMQRFIKYLEDEA